MNRITNDNPNGNMGNLLNMVFVKNNEVWLRGADEDFEDINLYDYVRQNREDWQDYSNEDIAELMCDEICDSVDLLYWIAVGFAENRERLKQFEDLISIPEKVQDLQAENEKLRAELEHYRKMEDEGRLLELPCKIGGSVYVPYSMTEEDGALDEGIEELHLSGYIKEGEREFYTTYNEDTGTCDIEISKLFLSREAAELAAEQAVEDGIIKAQFMKKCDDILISKQLEELETYKTDDLLYVLKEIENDPNEFRVEIIKKVYLMLFDKGIICI